MLFVDADVFIALYFKGDALHKRGVALLKKNMLVADELITSWDVVDETATKLSRLTNKKIAYKFLDEIADIVSVTYPNEGLSKSAIAIFNKQTSKRVSMTDCMNMAIMNQEKIKTVFSFDKHYERNGYKLLK